MMMKHVISFFIVRMPGVHFPVLVVVFKRCFSSRDGESAHKTHHLLFLHFTHAFVYKSITHILYISLK